MDVRERLVTRVGELGPMLVSVSRDIHAHPETMFHEHHAHDLLTAALEEQGLAVIRSAHGLDTAFRADVGDGPGPTVAVCLEYDALEEIGHACGHNVIAAAGLGAALGAAAVADEVGGRLRILGTPAEEGGNGKGLMVADGALDGVDAAVMVHPGDRDLTHMTTLAACAVWATYHGHASHSAASPWQGRNALDAAVLGYTNVGAMRQQLAPDQRVHGTFMDVPKRSNVIPERVTARWVARGRTATSMADARDKLIACLEAGALAARCEVDLEVTAGMSQVLDSGPLVERWVANNARLGRTVRDPQQAGHVYGSTDMGLVSRLVPSLHPVIKLAPEGVSIHERDFAAAAGSESGDKAVRDGALALALTIVDLWTDPELLPAARRAHTEDCAADPMEVVLPEPHTRA